MASPLFSIITVTLNPGDALGRTVDSVKSQKCRDFEHIIKDAGSTDGSLEQYARTANDYQPIIIFEPDRGIFDAMNQAMDHAHGKYVMFLNAGDILYSEDILQQVSSVVSQHSDLGLVYGDYFDAQLQLVIKSPKRLTSFYLYRTMLCHQACFVSHDIIEKLGRFDTSFPVAADYDLLLRVVRGEGVSYRYLEKTIASYMGGGSSSRPANAAAGAREARRLRKQHFPLMAQLLLSSLRAATLPALRIRLMRSKRCAFLQKMYTHTVNFWNSK